MMESLRWGRQPLCELGGSAASFVSQWSVIVRSQRVTSGRWRSWNGSLPGSSSPSSWRPPSCSCCGALRTARGGSSSAGHPLYDDDHCKQEEQETERDPEREPLQLPIERRIVGVEQPAKVFIHVRHVATSRRPDKERVKDGAMRVTKSSRREPSEPQRPSPPPARREAHLLRPVGGRRVLPGGATASAPRCGFSSPFRASSPGAPASRTRSPRRS